MTQTDAILTALKEGRTLTPLDALSEFGCLRLAARVRDLRDAGHPIETTIETNDNGKRFARYAMQEAHR